MRLPISSVQESFSFAKSLPMQDKLKMKKADYWRHDTRSNEPDDSHEPERELQQRQNIRDCSGLRFDVPKNGFIFSKPRKFFKKIFGDNNEYDEFRFNLRRI